MDPTVNRADLIDSKEAVARLGIKVATLYAYVSRGLIRSVGSDAPRKRLYLREDVERLRTRHAARAGHAAVAAGALQWGEPVLDTQISTITPQGPQYRGLSALELAASGAPFERVAEHLWSPDGTDAREPIWSSPSLGVRAARLAALLPGDAPPLAAMVVANTVIGQHDVVRHGAPFEAERVRARTLIRRLAASMSLPAEVHRIEANLRLPSVAAIATSALGGVPPRRRAVEAVNVALVLLADHELNASTFAARVAASAGADLYGCIGAALATAAGPRHGGAADRIEAFLRGIRTPANAAMEVRHRFSRGEEVPGFGHPLYPLGDPRTPPLLELARELAPRSPIVKAAFSVIEATGRAGHPPPSVDFALTVLSLALRLRPGSGAALFSLGRTAGWIAHVLEQRAAGFLLRPRARYVGRPLVPGAPRPVQQPTP